jgi:hypothetical protein
MGDFGRQSNRPHEPVTAGLTSGAGPGPEVLTGGAPNGTLAQTISSIAQQTGNQDLLVLAKQAANQV